MTLASAPLLTNGASHSAQSFRMMIRDLARGGQGITQGGDLRVTPLTVPAGGVQVGDGSAIIEGQAAYGQGHYTVYNIGAETVPIAPTGANPRRDLVVLRIQDPQYEGSRDPAKDPIAFFDVIPVVGAVVRPAPPEGYTAIALAVVTMPANTGTVTSAMIKDLRQLANPRRERRLAVNRGYPYEQLPTPKETWFDFPKNPVALVDIPTWAVQVNLVTTLNVRISNTGAYGLWRQRVGSQVGNTIVMDADAMTSDSRENIIIADALDIDASLRGTTQGLGLQFYRLRSEPWGMDINASTNIVVDVEFVEGVF
uniref:Uncharacterized protein n=1 Tax=Streptomyces sp. NBC_00003 TaxID=2903608 RepID=A0AAU2V896_9ACTN